MPNRFGPTLSLSRPIVTTDLDRGHVGMIQDRVTTRRQANHRSVAALEQQPPLAQRVLQGLPAPLYWSQLKAVRMKA